jgi:hypothetical protein
MVGSRPHEFASSPSMDDIGVLVKQLNDALQLGDDLAI